MDSEPVNLLFCLSNEHVKYALVTIESIYQHSKDKNIHVYISHYNINDTVKKRAIKYFKKRKIKYAFILFDVDSYCSFVPWREQINVYAKLFAHDLLPQNVSRVLFLDTDTVVDGDIRELYDLDFEDKAIIASYEYGYCWDLFIPNRAPKPKHKYPGGIINTGVLLINLKKLRDNGVS